MRGLTAIPRVSRPFLYLCSEEVTSSSSSSSAVADSSSSDSSSIEVYELLLHSISFNLLEGSGRSYRENSRNDAMAGGMEVHKNEFVERWATKRENLETVFRFNRRTVPVCLAFGVALPLLIYHGIVAEFNKMDKIEGRQPRKFL